ncbi:MAG TPA: hypothetical protein VNY83_00035 [Solirubrobacterales bacterium]|jgi:hypothetical protein|nr:hypothetical protein [Solirubrobacterales bacterium]
MDQGARFPKVAAKAGHYESFYVKACRPGGGQGVWIRHTVHKRPGADPNASIWFVLFDREAEGPRATKVTVPAPGLSAPAGSWIRVDGAEIGPGRAEGAIATDALRASWNFTFSGDAKPCRYLPVDWLYEAPVPRTKFVAPYPNAGFDGHLEIDGETVDLTGWPGMIGHNWGTEHAERWVWLEGTGFADSPDTYFDAGAARIKLGPWTTPWIPSGMLMLEGEAHRLGGLGQIRSASIEESTTACEFTLPGKGILVRGKVSAPKKDFVGWIYADPKGPEHNTINCSVSDLELTVERPGKPAKHLSLSAGAAYELGMKETTHGVPVQPYTDG